jgi:hypothetical protein
MLELQRHRDGIIGLISGAVFGVVSLIVGHPFDTLKTSTLRANKVSILSLLSLSDRFFDR